ncbi:hypothetical protein FACS189452_05390 [Bacteroidia bacterium]|nr:hypothetical protein FACS189452_05390 [Bacteroidia bacterium]
MRLFAVTGNPILHSKSPLLFGAAYPDNKQDFCYFRLHADSADEALKTFTEIGLSGMNVTAPFKSDILQLIETRSDTTVALNACNTIVATEKGLYADNTDTEGVSGAIHQAGTTIANARCLVLGAGGAGSAAAYALHKAGGIVTIANRTIATAQALSKKIGCSFCGLDDLAEKMAYAEIIVNTLSSDVINTTWLTPHHTLLDAVYPNETLRYKVENRCGKYIDGTQWLLHQGIPAYRAFTGIAPNVDAMRQRICQPSPYPRHIAFIGFMGVGKSTTAKLVAKQLDMPLVDTDLLIEKQCNDTIPHIIQQKGEDYFRKIEQEVICQVLAYPTPHLISCGGGAVTTPEVRTMLHQNSIVIWLYAPVEECLANIENIVSRPLLMQGSNPLFTAKKLFEERIPMYAQTAWMLVNTSNKTTEQVTKTIYDEVNRVLAH